MEHSIETVELSIQDAKDKVQRGKDLEKLLSNRIFNRLFTEGYCEAEAIRLVELLGHPHTNMSDHSGTADEKRRMVTSQMEGVNHFKEYIRGIRREAAMAEKALEDLEQTADELREEA